MVKRYRRSFTAETCPRVMGRVIAGAILGLLAPVSNPALALPQSGSQSTDKLKQLSLDELFDLEVTSVSRRPERLNAAASAIQVISADDIRRAGAASIPEALRLATNLQVAQANASQWAVSARGFNNVLANKLLVLIDGRTVYTPLYAGVFWDAQDTLLEDIDRIEVISGPGGTLWGANAVNGVINISTKSARETQGTFAEVGTGTEQSMFGAARFGGTITPNVAYRVYGKAFDRDNTVLAVGGRDARDTWRARQGGFRTDWESEQQSATLQGDIYRLHPNPDGTSAVQSDGYNFLGRWRYRFDAGSELQIQMYYDRTRRDFQNGFIENLHTFDFDSQHRFQLGRRQEIVWGLGLRSMEHQTQNLPLFAFVPAQKDLNLYSGFLQDELSLWDNKVRVTAGIKLEHNDYTGTEWQPNARFAWTPIEQQTLWAAASRAVRTPVRFDRDFRLSLTPTIPFIAGGDFQSETVHAYELGWRSQWVARMSTSLATFYNEYDGLRSVEPGNGFLNLPVTFGNGVGGESYGAEFSATYTVTDAWRLRGGYTWMRKHLRVKPGSRDTNNGSAEANDPDHQVLLQSILTLPHDIQMDGVVRYVDTLSTPHVDSYVEMDIHLAWHLTAELELTLVGQNLLDGEHAEFVPSSPSARNIERSVYGKITWRL